mgnify:CR=1 FL=1
MCPDLPLREVHRDALARARTSTEAAQVLGLLPPPRPDDVRPLRFRYRRVYTGTIFKRKRSTDDQATIPTSNAGYEDRGAGAVADARSQDSRDKRLVMPQAGVAPDLGFVPCY